MISSQMHCFKTTTTTNWRSTCLKGPGALWPKLFECIHTLQPLRTVLCSINGHVKLQSNGTQVIEELVLESTAECATVPIGFSSLVFRMQKHGKWQVWPPEGMANKTKSISSQCLSRGLYLRTSIQVRVWYPFRVVHTETIAHQSTMGCVYATAQRFCDC